MKLLAARQNRGLLFLDAGHTATGRGGLSTGGGGIGLGGSSMGGRCGIDPEFDIMDAFVERAMGADVATVVIGGKIVVENHQPRTIDVEGLYREVRAFCAKGLTPEQRAHADFLQKIKPYVQAWYRTWHQTMVDQPFYRVNSRT